MLVTLEAIAATPPPAGLASILEVFRPEWELRRKKAAHEHVVPDAIVTLTDRGQSEVSVTWMVEFDSGSERSRVWVEQHFREPRKLPPGSPMPPYKFSSRDLDRSPRT